VPQAKLEGGGTVDDRLFKTFDVSKIPVHSGLEKEWMDCRSRSIKNGLDWHLMYLICQVISELTLRENASSNGFSLLTEVESKKTLSGAQLISPPLTQFLRQQ
jgi:hypothetical protein